MRILVVDDNFDVARSLSLLLGSWGCEVRTAHDGLRAIETAKAYPPDVVLLDLKMPRMDGFEVAAHLRHEEWAHDLKLVALTGCSQIEDQAHAIQAGFDHFMVKPVEPKSLKDLLETLKK